MSLIDDQIDGALQVQIHHNLTVWMVDAGQALDALARYEKARLLYDEHFQAPSLRLRRRWLEGRIYAALGDLQLAAKAFEEVRATAIDRELSYELAMVSLDLALVYLRLGQTHRVQDLAEEMTIIFRSHELHRHALGAMYLFRQGGPHRHGDGRAGGGDAALPSAGPKQSVPQVRSGGAVRVSHAGRVGRAPAGGGECQGRCRSPRRRR